MRFIFIPLIVLLGFIHSAFGYEKSDITSVILLGTGTPNPVPESSGPATAIIVNDTAYIVDFGPGVMRRAESARQLYDEPALFAKNIKHAFLTHLHWDHSAGFPDLLLTGWTMGRDTPLTLVGPPGTAEMANNILAAFEKDIAIRLNGLEPANNEGWRVNTTIGVEGIVYQDNNVTVEAIPVCHGNWDYASGYKFTTPDRTIVISGDTTYCPRLEEASKEIDILIHEVDDGEALQTLSEDWRQYHTAFHTTAHDVGKLAAAAKPKLLILHHQLTWGSDNKIMEQVRAVYDGEIIYGKDLDRF